MKKIAVIHYMPLEFYPPVTNFLDIVSTYKNNEVRVYSTKNNKGRDIYANSRLKRIFRSWFPDRKESGLMRIFKYFKFNLSCFFNLIRFQPNTILYYESYSAWPVYWYLMFFGNKTELLIHYHEYTSPTEYLKGMRLVKVYHSYEKKYLYKRALWISHTNQQRIDLFLNDIPDVDPLKMQVVPNYPPGSWLQKGNVHRVNGDSILRTVYVGSLSLRDTYIKEYCEWVLKQHGMVTFDIYSFNLHDDTYKYLESLDSEYIRFYSKGVEYNEIPEILSNSHVGVILYKGLTENYVYNAPNKLFEYLACGLKVIYPDKMLGMKPYDSEHVMPLNFEALGASKLFNSYSSDKQALIKNKFIAEDALKPLVSKLSS
ncbi:hypothetical protein MWU76_04465 [Gelidibacter sp. F2691]|nr:hypothetical protein [Gelidibacter sp. F2691]